MMTKESIRVLVVEDHHVVRQGLVALLNVAEGLEVVGEAADGVEAITQFRKHLPDITLVDLRLPRMSWSGRDPASQNGDAARAFHCVNHL
jgi:DNA-binding NarL/FixJ family response regulator